MKKHLFLKSLLVALGLLIMSINTAWGQSFGAENQRQAQMQSQMMMSSGSSYSGTVYQPFSNTTPSQNSVPTVSGVRRNGSGGLYPGWHQNENGEWVPDNVEEYEETGGGVEIDRSSLSPIGEPWVMLLFALAFAGVIAIRQYKRKKAESMNMKNSTGKFIATLALLCTLGVGQMWGYDLDGRFYFNNSLGWSDVSIVYGNNDKSVAKHAIHISNTNLWTEWFEWGDYKDMYFIPANWTGEEANKPWDRINNNGFGTNNVHPENNKNYKDDKSFYFTTSSNQENLPKYTAYFRTKISEDGGESYGDVVENGTQWKAKFDFTGTYMDNDYTSAQSTIANLEYNSWESYGTKYGFENIPVTGEVTFTWKSANDDAYELHGWGVEADGTPSNHIGDNTVTYNITGNTVYVAFIRRKQFAVTFAPKGTYGTSTVTAQISSSSITSGSSHNYGSAITFTATPADGYKIEGWYSDASCTVSLGNGTNTTYSGVSSLTSVTEVYVKFVPKTCNLTLDCDETGSGNTGNISNAASLTATYDAAMTALTGTMPTGTNGYRFQGFYSETGGKGTKYYDKDGSSAHTWNVATEDAQTLYAFYEKDTISSLELSATAVHPWVSDGTKDSITVTPETLLTPDVGTVIICYSIEYSNGDPYDQSSTIFDNARVMGGNSIKFRAPVSSGSYRLKAELKTTNCSGTLLDTKYANFVVVMDNAITVKYLCENEVIQESTSKSINALDSVSVTAPTIEGYTFSEWEYSAGITSASPNNVNPKKFVASAPGTIKAKYVETPTVYFYNNLGWTDVWVTYDAYWDDMPGEGYKGAGNNGKTYHHMKNIMGTDIWYDEVPTQYTENGFKDWAWQICFNNEELANNDRFSSGEAVFRYDFDPQNTMFVPAKAAGDFTSNGVKYRSSSSTLHVAEGVYVHTSGYWKKYNKTSSGYSLRGTFAGIVEGEGNWDGTNHNLVSENANDSVFRTKLKLNGNTTGTYYFRIYRNNKFLKLDKATGFTYAGLVIKYNQNRTGNDIRTDVTWVWSGETSSEINLQTATEGEYTFVVTFKNNGTMKVDVEFPDNVGDYQVMYKDAIHTNWHPTTVVLSDDDTKATTSFFVRKRRTPQIQWRNIMGVADNGTITWSPLKPVSLSSYTGSGKILDASATGVDTTGVYNFIFNVSDGSLSLSDVQKYNGEYYIRTNSASSWKWQHYLESDHHMTYSDYADAHSGYSHYFMKYVGSGTNVKFVVANPYSPCISDTLGQGTQTAYVDGSDNLKANANIRYSWNMHDNSLNRAYVGMVDRTHTPRQATKFIVLQGESGKLKDKDGKALNSANQGTMYVGNDAIEFDDDENWIYEQTVQAVPGGRVKIYSHVDGVDEENDQYLIGDAPLSGGSAWESSNSEVLISGTGGDYENIRVIFDFKTNRLMAAWVPAAAINTPLTVQADIMILRTHQGNANYINLSGSGQVTLTTGKTVYGVMRFNKYILNNLVNGTSTPLDPGSQKTIYERSNYYISFPFKVSVQDIFGFGSYGPTWTLRYYDGKGRAKKGFWADSDSFWKYVAPFDTLQANQGYLLTLNMNKFTTDQEVWNNGVENIELYFPAVGAIDIQQVSSFDIDSLKVADYKSTINRGEGTDGDRRIKDSFWRCIGVPSFATIAATNDDSQEYAMNWDVLGKDLPFLYQVNWNTNGLTVVKDENFTFQPMHAYMVQNGNLIRWRNIVRPASVVARQSEVESITFELELSQEGNKIDHTYIRLTDYENVTADFDFGQDLSKEFNPGANIYTKIGYEQVAANVMPLSNTTTMVPIGLKIAEEVEYTFAMPEGTNGVSVILIDNIAGTRTNLALTDYTVNLTAGTYDERFILEISPMAQTPTDIESVAGEGSEISGARKVMVDGILYIVKDGKVFDARGTLCK